MSNTVSMQPPIAVARERQRLLNRISQRYPVVTRLLQIGALSIPFTKIENPDSVLDEVVREADRREQFKGQKLEDDELHLPYWAELWDSALGVAQWLCAHEPKSDTGKSVLDLGCGMGLAGTVARALGHRVTLVDIEAEALLLARYNATQFGEVRAQRIDWKRHTLDERFDLILGADVLYDKSQWEHLSQFWQKHLTPGGAVVLGEPGRQTGELFVDWISTREWRLEESQQKILSREKPIRLFRLLR